MTEEKQATMCIQELAPYIGCSIPMCRKLIRKKLIPYRKVGNRYVFDTPMIDLWIKRMLFKGGISL